MRSSRSSSDASVRSAMEVVDDYQIFVKLLSGESELLFHTHNVFSILINPPPKTSHTVVHPFINHHNNPPPASLHTHFSSTYLPPPRSCWKAPYDPFVCQLNSVISQRASVRDHWHYSSFAWWRTKEDSLHAQRLQGAGTAHRRRLQFL